MKRITILSLLSGVFFYMACKKDDYPIPPASTVPSFNYTVNNNGFAPATVVFTNTSIVPDRAGSITYNWNFGDGSSDEGVNPTHIYLSTGAFVVSMVAVTSGSLEIRQFSRTIVIKDPSASGVPVFFTDGTQVFSGLVNNIAPVMEILPVTGLQDSYGTTYDSVRNKLYISDYSAGTISRCNPDGTGLEVFRSGLDAPNALSIDYVANQLYWDTGNGVQKGDMNNTDVNQKDDFVTGQANDPDGIYIDPVGKTLFWINYNGGIWKKNLDGSGESEIIPAVEGGSIIVANNRIYFDQYIGPADIHLKSAKLDGSDIAVLATGVSRVVYGLAYEPNGQKIYWGDRNKGTIMRANPDGSGAEAWYIDLNVSPRGIVFGKKF